MSEEARTENEEPKEEPKEEEKAEQAEDTSDEKAGGGKQFQEIIDGTARLGSSIGEALKGAADIFTGRDYVVMVRVNKDSLDNIDALVESGLFKSRSESAAFLIAQGIRLNNELYSRINDKVSEINRLKVELKDLLDLEKE